MRNLIAFYSVHAILVTDDGGRSNRMGSESVTMQCQSLIMDLMTIIVHGGKDNAMSWVMSLAMGMVIILLIVVVWVLVSSWGSSPSGSNGGQEGWISIEGANNASSTTNDVAERSSEDADIVPSSTPCTLHDLFWPLLDAPQGYVGTCRNSYVSSQKPL